MCSSLMMMPIIDEIRTFFKILNELVDLLIRFQNKDMECVVNEHIYSKFAEHLIIKNKNA